MKSFALALFSVAYAAENNYYQPSYQKSYQAPQAVYPRMNSYNNPTNIERPVPGKSYPPTQYNYGSNPYNKPQANDYWGGHTRDEIKNYNPLTGHSHAHDGPVASGESVHGSHNHFHGQDAKNPWTHATHTAGHTEAQKQAAIQGQTYHSHTQYGNNPRAGPIPTLGPNRYDASHPAPQGPTPQHGYGYQAPKPQYGYQAPKPAYQAPKPTYGYQAPKPAYGQSHGYQAPKPAYMPQQHGYQQQSHGGPYQQQQPYGAVNGYQGNANHSIPQAHYQFGQVNWGNDRVNALFAKLAVTGSQLRDFQYRIDAIDARVAAQ